MKNELLELWRALPKDPFRFYAEPAEAAHTPERIRATFEKFGIPLPEMPERFGDYMAGFWARDHATRRWSWAIPDEHAIAMLVKYSPLIEIGAGTGYWAALASAAGADVVAFDQNPPALASKRNHWHPNTNRFFDVRRGGAAKVHEHPGRTLFLCWPPMQCPMPGQALAAYTGDIVIFVGEMHGCCENGDFTAAIERDWDLVEEVDNPQWHGIHDYMGVYRRKSGASPESRLSHAVRRANRRAAKLTN
jgi:hypothetical protein